jgi:GMP synthase-like glutamine amidotransferase
VKIHWLQHVPFEGLGAIEGWLVDRGHSLSRTRLYAGEEPPATPDGFDWLIAVGGPMSVHQVGEHPWLAPEKRLIRRTADAGKRILGICLGAQLLAEVLGGAVRPNGEREIGWFPVRAIPGGAGSPFGFPPEIRVFHWHGETFSLPPGSVWLAESDGCAHQAFAVGSRILGLQFHLEMREADIVRLADACAGELTAGRYVQPAEEFIAAAGANGPAAGLLDRLLGALEAG